MQLSVDLALKDALVGLFKDKQLLLIAVINALILSAFSYYIISSALHPLLSSLASTPANAGAQLGSIVGWFISVLAIEIVVWLVSLFFVVAIMAKAYNGAKMGIMDALGYAARRYLGALAVAILLALIATVPYIIVILSAIASPILFLFLFVIYAVGIIYLSISLCVALPFSVLGRKGPVASLTSSLAVVRGNWWRIFAIFFVIGIIYYIIVLILEVPMLIEIFSPVTSVVHTAGAGGAVNGTTLSSQIFSGEEKAFSSPLFVVASFVGTLLYAWFIIALASIYRQFQGPQPKMQKGRKNVPAPA
jgi:hypothetical protein